MAGLALAMVVTLAVAGTAHAQGAFISGAGIEVGADDVRSAAQRIPDASRDAVLARASNVQRQAEDIYVRRALAIEAERDGLDKAPEVLAQLRQARERILSDARLAAIEKAALPEPSMIERYAREIYTANPQRFQTPEQTRARHILVGRSPDGKERERAEELLAKLKGGASFEQLARDQSADFASGANGGDLGWFTAGSMVKPFEDAVAALKEPGELSGVVETPFGFHIIKLEGRRPAGVRTFDEVRPDLERQVREQVQNDARQAKAVELVKSAKTDADAIETFSRQFRKP